MQTIVVEARALSGPPAGVVRYIRGLLRGLHALAPSLPIQLVTDHARGLAEPLGWPGRAVGPSAPWARPWWNKVSLPSVARQARAGLVHLTKPSAFPAGRSRPLVVTTVYDVIPLQFPDTQTLAQRAYWRVELPRAARAADHILTISETSKEAICSRLGILPKQVTVTLPGLDPLFHPPSAADVAAVRSRYHLDGPVLLTVSTIEPRKNIALLLRVFAEVVRTVPHTLVVAGRWGWRTQAVRAAADDPRLAGRVRFLGPVPAEDLPGLYGAADVFMSLSRAEGFGFPPLEAMAVGTPTIVSETPVHREVASDAAALVPLNDQVTIQDTLRRVLLDPGERDFLRARGRHRALAFRWENTARATLAVYARLLGEPLVAAPLIPDS